MFISMPGSDSNQMSLQIQIRGAMNEKAILQIIGLISQSDLRSYVRYQKRVVVCSDCAFYVSAGPLFKSLTVC